MRDLQTTSCPQGFAGWLFWTWDTADQRLLYTVTESNGAINGQLAPVVRSTFC